MNQHDTGFSLTANDHRGFVRVPTTHPTGRTVGAKAATKAAGAGAGAAAMSTAVAGAVGAVVCAVTVGTATAGNTGLREAEVRASHAWTTPTSSC